MSTSSKAHTDVALGNLLIADFALLLSCTLVSLGKGVQTRLNQRFLKNMSLSRSVFYYKIQKYLLENCENYIQDGARWKDISGIS